jgi:hypothetical protein
MSDEFAFCSKPLYNGEKFIESRSAEREGGEAMGTLVFTVLHFLGYTDRPDEWYTLCYLISLDMISLSILFASRCRHRAEAGVEAGRHES